MVGIVPGNADGLRVQKRKVTIYGSDVTTNYILHGKNIVHMTQGTDTLHFWYDAQGRPAIVEYNGTKYAYIHILQGDIVGIIDSTGAEVVQYTYDAWGKVLSTAGTMATTLGTVQPFRYRGYVYDVETGLYYLRSRYYNPEWGRFINADVLMKGNLFAYCKDKPIIGFDPDGKESTDIYERFIGNPGDSMQHVLNKNFKDGRMPMAHFLNLLGQMIEEKWQYSHDTAYGYVDCVGVYRYTMYWFFSEDFSENDKYVKSNVSGLYEYGVYNKTNKKISVIGKGRITHKTKYTIGMELFRNPESDDGHVAYYVGNWFEGYENAVIEAVSGGVVIRELSESEAINGAFTHYGYLKGLQYGFYKNILEYCYHFNLFHHNFYFFGKSG